MFVQSDTVVDGALLPIECKPDILISTHNAQIPPDGYLGAFDNMLPIETLGSDEQNIGLNILSFVLNESAAPFPGLKRILLSGGGYIQLPVKHGPFLYSDFRVLAEIANELSIGTKLIGLRPGECLEYSDDAADKLSKVDWISSTAMPSIDPRSFENAGEALDDETDLPAIFKEIPNRFQLDLLEDELQQMVPLLMMSPLGIALINTNFYLGNTTGAYRFCFHIRNHAAGEHFVFALNFNDAKFEQTNLTLRDAIFTIPSGIDVNASDLIAVFQGRLNIWELATSRTKQWYMVDKLDSPIAFLYNYLSEQVRPDLAEKLYRLLASTPIQ